jgi:hypothetical protein
MDGSCSMTEDKFKNHARLKHRDHLGELRADEKIILE